jgi:hypothetical protein
MFNKATINEERLCKKLLIIINLIGENNSEWVGKQRLPR